MDDIALLELPDDPTTLRGIILAERAGHAATLKERDILITQRDESIQLLSQTNQLLFAGHDESAQCHAILWSLIASAQRQEAEGKASAAEGKASAFDVQLYLRSVLAHLPGLPAEELQNYLPDVWKRDLMAEQQAALNVHHGKLIRAMSR